MRASVPILALALAACGSAQAEPRNAQATRHEASVEVSPPPAPAPPERQGTIERARLDRVLAGGLGRFLQHVRTEPHLEDGRFVGFRLTEMDEELFGGVDLSPGDTLISVNGRSIERPEQALQVWNGLRVASELTVEYLRQGERHQLRYEIAD